MLLGRCSARCRSRQTYRTILIPVVGNLTVRNAPFLAGLAFDESIKKTTHHDGNGVEEMKALKIRVS